MMHWIHNLCLTTITPWKSIASSLLLRKLLMGKKIKNGGEKVRFFLTLIALNLPIKL